VLTHDDVAAANTFQHPNAVTPSPLPVSVAGDGFSVVIPKQAVAAIEMDIA
jgi:alpha-L-arabinofuranosidase